MNRKIVCGIIGFLIFIFLCSFVVGSLGKGEAKEHINLGNKYMENLDYEQALAEYMTALEISPDNEKAASGIELASVKYAEELLTGDISIEDCNDLLNILEDSYGVVPKESIESQMIKIEQILKNKEAERFAKEQEAKEKREREEKEKREREEKEKREQEEEKEQEERKREKQEKIQKEEIEENLNQQQTNNWVDDLYNKMIAGDSEGVFAIISSTDFKKRCEEYECYVYKKVIPHEAINARFYLLTSDGKEVWGNYIVDEYDDEDYVNVIYSPHDDGNDHYGVYGGDYVYEMSNGEKWWLYGITVHEDNGAIYEINYGEMLWVYP